MKPEESYIKFYQERCPALKSDKWEWYDRHLQSFSDPKAKCLVGRIQFTSTKERLANVYAYFWSDGQTSWFALTVKGLGYPSFAYGETININAYKADSREVFTQANMQGSLLLQSKMEEIKAKEQEWLDELERIKP